MFKPRIISGGVASGSPLSALNACSLLSPSAPITPATAAIVTASLMVFTGAIRLAGRAGAQERLARPRLSPCSLRSANVESLKGEPSGPSR